MKNKVLRIWMLIGIVIILFIATIWHFIYGWFESSTLALIAPVNESPWEHVKMFFAPAIIFYIIEFFFIGKSYKNYVFSKGVAIIVMPILMFAMFYGYRDLLNIPEKLSYDIVVTIISIIIGSLISYIITISNKDYSKYRKLTPITICILFISYGFLTFFPPKVPLFYDRNFDGYGINEEGHDDHDHE